MSRNYHHTTCSTCGLRNCEHPAGEWEYSDYIKVNRLQPEDEYIISKLAEQPTLAAGLDELYRRMPQRWHKLLAASIIKRKAANAAA